MDLEQVLSTAWERSTHRMFFRCIGPSSYNTISMYSMLMLENRSYGLGERTPEPAICARAVEIITRLGVEGRRVNLPDAAVTSRTMDDFPVVVCFHSTKEIPLRSDRSCLTTVC
ncbi:unnamed protein product [Periconia digitata]|uniref:Uncharacterized protein n=1 Tax=Periconia digitata TaxID=1303443 RepID=A0A9W4UID1_9PLEO|nr:unnamed protein product [Periconia digitata]